MVKKYVLINKVSVFIQVEYAIDTMQAKRS
jgi:hypothetical protein